MEFRISSGLKDIIGRELITDDLVAIFELVKNSYDAGAKNVKLIFENIAGGVNAKSRIYVVDDGKGMSREELEKKWLFVGYSEKKIAENPINIKQKSGRIAAGSKGIGRFSCDKLGSNLSLYTRSKMDKFTSHLTVIWDEFEKDQGTEFQKIKIDFKEGEFNLKHSFPSKTGTILEISGLREGWDHGKLLKLKRYLQRLINPTNIDKSDQLQISIDAKEYLTKDDQNIKGDFFTINGIVRNILLEQLNLKSTSIVCDISSDGKHINTELRDKVESIIRFRNKNGFGVLRDIKLILFFLSPESKRSFTRLMGVPAVQYGSIFLYKNGFRLHPCGDPGNDWLNIDKRKTQGFARYLGTRELLGRVEINGFQRSFKEISSRDGGLQKNAHYDLLVDFVYKKLRILEKYVVEGLGWDSEEHSKFKTADEQSKDIDIIVRKLIGDKSTNVVYNKNLQNLLKDKEIEKLPHVIKNLEDSISREKDLEKKEFLSTQLKSFEVSSKRKSSFLKKEAADAKRQSRLDKKKRKDEEKARQRAEEDARKEKELRERAEKETSFYKDKNPGGVEVKNITHTVGLSTFKIHKAINYLMKNIDSLNKKTIMARLDSINFENDRIRTMANVITRSNFNMQVKRVEKDFAKFIVGYLENISTLIESDIKIVIENKISTPVLKKFKPLEICMVIDNFISNARKAKASKILFELKKVRGGIRLRIYDTGKGIDKGNASNIFDLGFSMTDGSGIGLYHIRKILASPELKSSISFVGNKKLAAYKGACFEVKFDE